MIKNIILDMGGVILDLNKKPLLQIANSLSEVLNYPLPEIQAFDKNNGRGIINGTESIENYVSKVIANFNINSKYSINEIIKKLDKLSEKEPGLVDWDLINLAEALKSKGYKLCILSDTFNLGQKDPTSQKIYNTFDINYLSFEQGTNKADGSSFKKFLNNTGFIPAECIFFDDIPLNVEQAVKHGINAFLYIGLSDCVKTLEKFGVRTNQT